MKRRGLFGALAALALAAPRRAHAGTYLDAAAVLLDESRRALDFAQAHAMDAKLGALLAPLAEARVRAGRKLAVPREAEKAHPHLLLALEGAERAIAAMAEGSPAKLLRLAMQARDDERSFRAMLLAAHLALPDLDRK